jgi:S-DNA-T family DNA segregation ATPase FtsK/SpoIIIE
VFIAAAQATEPGDLIINLGPEGLATLLAVGALVLTWKSRTIRQAEWKAFRWACRHAWELLRLGVLLALGRPVPSAEERKLLRRLAPKHWKEHAPFRGLAGTLTARPKLTAAGVVVAVRLDGTWTPSRLAKAEDNVRALLGCRSSLRIEIETGKRGGWARMTLRTRSAVDGADMTWTPERRGIGLDTVTGEPVDVHTGTRLLLAGSSGAGKSVTLRPLLAAVAADPVSAVVMVDLKRVEGALWRSRARIARTPDEVEAVAGELVAEMLARLTELEDLGAASWTPTPARPRIVVVVDEGAEVSTAAKDALPALESIARMGRAAEIHIWWCTQKPTMSGASAGIPPQISAQMDVRLCLRVATATEVRTVLGEDASAEGWDAHKLPKPGVLLIRGTGRKPVPVKVWFMDDDTVRALPAAPVWRRNVAPNVSANSAGSLSDLSANLTAGAPVRVRLEKGPTDIKTRVLNAVRAAGRPVRQKDVADATGISKGTVSKTVGALVDAGRLQRHDDGSLTLTGRTEVAA